MKFWTTESLFWHPKYNNWSEQLYCKVKLKYDKWFSIFLTTLNTGGETRADLSTQVSLLRPQIRSAEPIIITTKNRATIAIIIICSQGEPLLSNLIYNYFCLQLMRAQNTLVTQAEIMKINLFSRLNSCYELTIPGNARVFFKKSQQTCSCRIICFKTIAELG